MRLPNILFLPIDDLRPQLSCYGHSQMVTPHLDGLAASGTLFKNAYCQVPVCGATRASLLTGVRPNRQRFVDFATEVDADVPGVRTLPQHFREHGYTTLSVGKVFHHLMDTAERSWSETPWNPRQDYQGTWRNYAREENRQHDANPNHRGPAFECAEVPDDAYFDGMIADRAIAELHRLKDGNAPWFLAAGFLKPHLPFNAPKRYWDYYRHDAVPLAPNPDRPLDAPDQALHNWGELRHYFEIPREGPLSEEMARDLVHGYYAATSYMDAQVGRVLECLETLGMADNTIVVAWGDHGWQLGEHGLWCKHCNFQTSLNAPLIVRTPEHRSGTQVAGLVEFLDIYPTLCELAGLSLPDHLQGSSLAPVLESPRTLGKAAAFCRYHGGESVRFGEYLYTEFLDTQDVCSARMLYDHRSDPHENVNIAEHQEMGETVTRLSGLLAANRRAAAQPITT